ncbi:MAG: nodulation protein NfeD [Labilithrix sp.]|nr:nodulation protein NfeD [Labilithrix sp.]
MGAARRWTSAVLLVLVALLWSASAEAHAARARLLTIGGAIDPVAVRYVERELQRARVENADVVVIQLDTPGGLETSMRAMTQALLGSRVPVAVFVAPPGARAASAGTFIVLAADVAAMAPGTEIGAAHPVNVGGRDGVLETKAVNDAAALARALAQAHHRNADWAERAVRDSASLTAEEALRARVIDRIAIDVPDLLDKVDGFTVATTGTTLRTAGAVVEARPMLATERLLSVLANPNVAYLLFLLGLLGLSAELYHPGAIVPGLLGGISLVLALVAFGNLPISWAALLLIVGAIALFIAELHTGTGALAAGAIVALVTGSLLLYGPPGAGVSAWLIALMTLLSSLLFLVVIRAAMRARRLAVRTGVRALIGQPGVAVTELAPAGTVRVDSEVWTAEAVGDVIHIGERVEVVGAAGVTLRVSKPSEGTTPWQPRSSTSS